jgi:uncharacterized protein
MNPTQPLTETEIQRLADFLCSEHLPEESLTIDELHGLLTALICGPEIVHANRWLPLVWGGQEPGFDSMEQAQDILGLIMRMNNQIADTLLAGEGFAPLVPVFTNEEQQEVADATGWCYGFLYGIGMSSEQWETHFEELYPMMTPILVLGSGDTDDPEIVAALADPDHVETMTRMLPLMVQAIYDYWRQPEVTGAGEKPSKPSQRPN